jgi:mannose-6-phosphate isomerase-like protein (cupin superfamily)
MVRTFPLSDDEPRVPSESVTHAFTKEQLPVWLSTRDTRDRLDLVTENVPVPASRLRADRIRYHPGDSAAPHYHVGCDHVFVVLEGSGIFHAGEESWRLSAGMAATVEELEVHWFENDTDADFVFVEYWAPFPVDTVWVDSDDI